MDESKRSFAIIRHNFQTFEGRDVVQVVRGRGRAEITVDIWDGKLSQEEKAAGWTHFLEPTSLKPGTDPKFATQVTRLKSVVRRAKELRTAPRLRMSKHLR